MKTLILTVAILLAGCATESHEFRDEERLVEARDAFHQEKASCQRIGGIMNVQRSPSRIKRLSADELELAICN